MSTAYIMKAAECVAAAEKISDRIERAALLITTAKNQRIR
jgi:hypothetical protein